MTDIRKAILDAAYEVWKERGLSGWLLLSSLAEELLVENHELFREAEYLMAKGLVHFPGKGRLSITVNGVDEVEGRLS